MYRSRLFLLVAFGVMLGCHANHQVVHLTPTNKPIMKKARITFKDGKQIVLQRLEITDTKILGRDEKGNHFEEPLQNVAEITLLNDSKTARIIISTILGLPVAAILLLTILGLLIGPINMGS